MATLLLGEYPRGTHPSATYVAFGSNRLRSLQFGLQSLDEQRTEVVVKADVSIAGKLAQMGGGMIQNVSRQIFRKFAECARKEILDNDASTSDRGQKRKEGGVAAD